VPPEKPSQPGVTVGKAAREIVKMLELFDLTRCAWSAAELVGCDHKTAARYVALRDADADPIAPLRAINRYCQRSRSWWSGPWWSQVVATAQRVLATWSQFGRSPAPRHKSATPSQGR